jgi:hypothetical protein
MAVTLNHPGRPASRRSVYNHTTGTATEDVYECPPNCTAEISYLHVINTTGNVNIEIEWFVAASNYTSHFLTGKNLGAGEYITFSDIEIVLASGDKIQVTPSAVGHVDTILTITETFSSI